MAQGRPDPCEAAGHAFEDWPHPLALVAPDGRLMAVNRVARPLLGAAGAQIEVTAITTGPAAVRVRAGGQALDGDAVPVPDGGLLLRLIPGSDPAGGSVRAEERARLARDLHDGLSQTLAALRVTARLIEQRVKGDDDLGRHARQAARLAERAWEEMRRALDDISLPPPGNLSAAIGAVVEAARLPGGPAIVWEPPSSPGPSAPELVRELALIVREAVANALRHAEARTIRVQLGWTQGIGVVTVLDDGRGIGGSQPGTLGHFGLTFMRERAGRLSGQLELSDVPGGGTMVRLTFPAPAAGTD